MQYFHLNEEFKKSLYHFNLLRKKRRFFLTIKIFLVSFLIGLLISSLGIFSFKDKVFNSQISLPLKSQISLPKKEASEDLPYLKSDQEGRTNILFLGIPGKPWPGSKLADSIMVISFNKNTKKSLILSIPRDLLIKIPKTNWETKINALFAIDESGKLIQEAINEITGLEIHYFAILDLKTLEKLIDMLGGIEVEVKKEIYDPRFPRPDRGYEIFSLKAGFQNLDGKTAIKYIRTRHEARGDFSRIERQHQVIEAIFDKIKNSKILESPESFLKIFQETEGEIKGNFGILELSHFTSLLKKIEKDKIEHLILDAGKEDSLLVFGKTILGKNLASILFPKEGKFNYSKIKSKIFEMTTRP